MTQLRTLTLEQEADRRRELGEPSSERGAAILSDISAYVERFVAYPSGHARVAHTLWIVHTHLMDEWESTPRIAFLSPEPGSGKTRALEVTEALVPRPIEAVSVTPAYLFRRVSGPEGLPTILFDEIDTVFGPRAKENEELRGLLNAGHRRGALAGRCVVRGKAIETEDLPAYCAVAMAGLGNLPDTILSRSVVIRMRRRAPQERVEPYRRRLHAPEGYEIRDRLATWVMGQKVDTWPEMPEGVEDRDADVWEALIAVAEMAGDEWPSLARDAAKALVKAGQEDSPSLGVRLLADLRRIFGDKDEMWTETILTELHALDESPWGSLRGSSLDGRGLARYLRRYDVRPGTVRDGKRTAKGYKRVDLLDPWSRYLPSPDKSGTSGTSVTDSDAVTDVTDIDDDEAEI